MAVHSTIGLGGFSFGKDEIASSGFDHFQPQEIENGVEGYIIKEFLPVTSTSSAGPFSFMIPADVHHFTCLESLRIKGRMRIRKQKADGTLENLPDNAPVTTVNNVFDSLFRSFTVKLNGTSIKDPGLNAYSYKSYLEKHLSFSTPVKQTILPSRGYFMDTHDKLDSLPSLDNNTLTESTNTGAKKRRELFEKSKWVGFNIYPHGDVATMKKWIPPNVKIELTFERNPDEFTLLYNDNSTYKIELEDSSFKVRCKAFKASPQVEAWYNAKLRTGAHPYIPIDRSIVKTYTIPTGTTNFSHSNVITGVLPDQMIIGIIPETAYSGRKNENPYNFKVHGITEAYYKVDGVKYPEDGLKLDVKNNDTANMFAEFLENTGVGNEDREFGISEFDYYHGSFLIAFDRTTDQCNRFHRHEPKQGNIDLVIHSDTATTQTLVAIVYCTYSSDVVYEHLKHDPGKFNVHTLIYQ